MPHARVRAVDRRPRQRALLAVAWLAVFAAALSLPGRVQAEQLLYATLDAGVEFSLDGESREKVVGGELRLGERRFEITGLSRMGLIGATRSVREGEGGAVAFGEYAVFSSSFSDQTAVGQPWIRANAYHHCDEAYNSFLAVYRVEGAAAVEALGATPYAALTDDPAHAAGAVVYCFVSRPPGT